MVVAPVRLRAAWKMIDDDVRRIDWLASAIGPSLYRGKSIFLKKEKKNGTRQTGLTMTQPTRPAPTPTTLMLLDLSKKAVPGHILCRRNKNFAARPYLYPISQDASQPQDL